MSAFLALAVTYAIQIRNGVPDSAKYPQICGAVVCGRPALKPQTAPIAAIVQYTDVIEARSFRRDVRSDIGGCDAPALTQPASQSAGLK